MDGLLWLYSSVAAADAALFFAFLPGNTLAIAEGFWYTEQKDCHMGDVFVMMKKYTLAYRAYGQDQVGNERENEDYSLEIVETPERFRVILHPKHTICLENFFVSFYYDFKPQDWFYAGGYQSWTTSREYRCTEVQRNFLSIARATDWTKRLAGISSDAAFVPYSEKPGEFHSHCYTYIRNREKVTLFGSLHEQTGYTWFRCKMNENRFEIHKDVEGKKTSESLVLLDIVILKGSYDEVFDGYFSMMEMPKTRTGFMSGYTSWYNYFQKIDESIILRDLDGLDRVSDEVTVFQVDDGYETYVGDWLDPNPEKFPHGMRYIAEKIHAKGYKAGLWLAPFNCQIVSRIAKEHPDWLIRDAKGKPLLGCPGWGGAYTLDLYHEQARAYIRHVFDVVLNAWGYDMVKLDFLYSQCIQPRAGKSRGEIMCDAMAFLRECVGDKLLLGCGVPIGPALGKVDACRISCDVDLAYGGKYYNALHVNNEIPSAQNAILNTVFRRHLNGRAFMSDPDVFFLRNTNLKFTDEQKLLLARINNLLGNVLFVSDNAGDFDDEQLARLRLFFKKTNQKVTFAQWCAPNVLRLTLADEDGEKIWEFDLKKGVTLRDE